MRALLPFLLLATLALGGCSSTPAAVVHTDQVSIPGAWRFEPQIAEVAHGATVTWTNHGGQAHSITFDDGSDQDIAPGATATRTFATPGTHNYHCKYHPPDMKGSIIVD